jgi:hypothetical protein
LHALQGFIAFWSRSKEAANRYLSNFQSFLVRWDHLRAWIAKHTKLNLEEKKGSESETLLITVEFLFQLQKGIYAQETRPNALQKWTRALHVAAANGAAVKSLSGKGGFSKHGVRLDVPAWNRAYTDAMRAALAFRFTHDAAFSSLLREAKDRKLRFVHIGSTRGRDNVWIGKIRDSQVIGGNLLGQLLDELAAPQEKISFAFI